MSGLTEVTAPTDEPLTLAEVKDHLREAGTDQDALIADLIVASRQWAEGFARRAFITQTWDLTLDRFPSGNGAIEVFKPPLASVVKVDYIDTDGATQTWASSNYIVDAKTVPGRITPAFNVDWPDTRQIVNAVTVQFIAGYGGANAVPRPIKQAMLMLIGHLYENRENVVVGAMVSTVPQASEYLLWPYRVFWF